MSGADPGGRTWAWRAVYGLLAALVLIGATGQPRNRFSGPLRGRKPGFNPVFRWSQTKWRKLSNQVARYRVDAKAAPIAGNRINTGGESVIRTRDLRIMIPSL